MWLCRLSPQKIWTRFCCAVLYYRCITHLVDSCDFLTHIILCCFNGGVGYTKYGIFPIFSSQISNKTGNNSIGELAEWRSGSVSALPCERPGFASRARLSEIIPANNCTMQEQNNWGNWGSPGVMKLCVAWEVLRWLMKFRELCSWGFHPKLVTPPYHGFLNVNTPPNSQNSKRH